MAKYLSRAKRLEQALEPLGAASEVFREIADEAGKIKPKEIVRRMTSALDLVEGAMPEVEELKDELESWYDNLPDSFQNGSKGEGLQAAMDSLDEITEGLRQMVDDLVSLRDRLRKGEPVGEDDINLTFDEAVNQLEEASMVDVEFPGMYS